mmetsp:Transcript_82407/g.229592  ORF Transcript_82407/g.229592 Transcript_82407/m.229592 type:complete len:206 (-) Transcript_82407:1184-1801(-)
MGCTDAYKLISVPGPPTLQASRKETQWNASAMSSSESDSSSRRSACGFTLGFSTRNASPLPPPQEGSNAERSSWPEPMMVGNGAANPSAVRLMRQSSTPSGAQNAKSSLPPVRLQVMTLPSPPPVSNAGPQGPSSTHTIFVASEECACSTTKASLSWNPQMATEPSEYPPKMSCLSSDTATERIVTSPAFRCLHLRTPFLAVRRS